jgi:AraC-like DNA-binding protein
MSADALSEVLRAVRLNGAVFFLIDASSPWVAEAAPAHDIASSIMPGSEHLIEYHAVTSGSCYGGLPGEPSVKLEAGDILVFPQGDAHVMSSAPGMRGDRSVDLSMRLRREALPVARNLDGGGPERARVVCGFLGCDARPFNPLLASLPRMLHVRGRDVSDGVLRSFMDLALQESAHPGAGSQGVLARLSELMFIEVVRRHLSSASGEQPGWLNGLRDATVGRSLERLHAEPARPWSLEDLAKDVGVSRSILAERFTHFVGMAPMQYLSQWRMQLAAGMLASSSVGIAEIAEAVGYGSEAALSRAFKRLVGVSPAHWRREHAKA